MNRPAIALLFLTAALSITGNAQVQRRISAPTSFYDDADVPAPGQLGFSETFSYIRVPAGRDVAFPSAGVYLGVAKRFSVDFDTAYSRTAYENIRINALGNSYIGFKLQALPEAEGRPGIAVKTIVEVLGKASTSGNPLAPPRVNYAFPLIVQKSFSAFRAYNSVGYATRGIVFDSAVVELNALPRVTPVMVISGSRMTRELAMLSGLGLNRSRVDVTAGATFALGSNWSAFLNAGRTLGRMDENATRYQVTAGIGFSFRLWQPN